MAIKTKSAVGASVRDGNSKFELDHLPDECPHCFKSITPVTKGVHENECDGKLEVFMCCPNSSCKKSFIAYYQMGYKSSFYSGYNYLGHTSKGKIRIKEFTELIEDISERFIRIYNQAYHSEQEGMEDICGAGYRKALEYLIKDHILHSNPGKKDEIVRTSLGNCINRYVVSQEIKEVAKQAAWLGTDGTHYLNEYTEKDIAHLKDLINLTVHWIEIEKTMSRYKIHSERSNGIMVEHHGTVYKH